ncbi:hypothetical protein BC941DRAFT_40384 [Chlamydoabsidia padenii]|nr:hypothetical protein BC941DRAFT_40384 [Chlamydoabsidia padenii]
MASPRIYTAVYSGVPVFEMVVKDVAIMRRRNDSYMNATQILKVAGLEKGRRTKILEREIDPSQGEKVQGGYGKFQGTWIPLQISIELARRYQVYDLLQTMLEFDPTTAGDLEEKGHLPITKGHSPPIHHERTLQLAQKKRDQSLLSTTMTSSSYSSPPPPTQTTSNSDTHTQKKARTTSTVDLPTIEPSFSDQSIDAKHRTILMSIFLSDDTTNVSELLKTCDAIDLNLALDEQGNTALHWASSLARINTVEQLTARGADINRQNHIGETPLMRCVAATNSFDCDCFRKLLKFLEGSLYVSDHKQRTVLHHIALITATEGRTNAALYYMHHLLHSLDKLTPSNSNHVKTKFLNKQDDQGDTAISIATRLECPRMIQLLIDAGADSSFVNNIGLTPNDYGNESHEADTTQQTIQSPPLATSYNRRQTGPSERNKEIMSTIKKIVDALDDEYGDQASTREAQLKQVEGRLKSTTLALQQARQELEKRQEESQVYAEGQQKVRNLKQALETGWSDLESLLQKENKVVDRAEVLRFDQNIDSLVNPSATLKARVNAYERNNAALMSCVAGLRAETVEKEMQCKRLIAACCGLALGKVDELVEPLTLAIASDPPDLDLARVMGFMEKIRRQGSFPSPDDRLDSGTSPQ